MGVSELTGMVGGRSIRTVMVNEEEEGKYGFLKRKFASGVEPEE